MKSELPKVIIACPTAKQKKYAFVRWLQACMAIKYPNLTIRTFDNSLGNTYTNWMNLTFKEMYGEHNTKFKAIHVPVKSNSVIERMTVATEVMRQYCVNKRADFLMSIESDVFVPESIIEELMCENKQVIGAMYDRDEGLYRRLCIQTFAKEAHDSLLSENMNAGDEIGFVDGTIKRVSSVGLGAVLINMNVLKNIPFRLIEGVFPDQYFAETCLLNKVNIYSHTGIECEHQNNEWGILGRDFT